jgi:hypothetical protein
MKPHIFKGLDGHLWYCVSRLHGLGSVGLGNTPAEAYASWLEVAKVAP